MKTIEFGNNKLAAYNDLANKGYEIYSGTTTSVEHYVRGFDYAFLVEDNGCYTINYFEK